jgi:hypothetical protein
LEFFVLDLDRVTAYGGRVPRARALSNLAQLNAAIAAPVTRTDRLRAFFAYAARDRELRRNWKAAVKDVMRLTRARRHRWPGIRVQEADGRRQEADGGRQ